MASTIEERVSRLESVYDRVATKDDLEELRAETKAEMAKLATKNEVNRLRSDIAPLKAAHARNAAVEQADFIAEDMGFELRRVLSRQDIKWLLKGQDVSDISRAAIRSFRLADLIMEVVDERGNAPTSRLKYPLRRTAETPRALSETPNS